MKLHRIPKPDVSILTAIFILIFCLEAAVLNYEHVYKATPDYSVRILTEAIQNGDEDTVTALVDDKAIASGLFDGMASRSGGMDSLPVLQLAWAPLRDDFIRDSSRLFHLSIQKGKTTRTAPGQPKMYASACRHWDSPSRSQAGTMFLPITLIRRTAAMPRWRSRCTMNGSIRI